MGDAHALCGTLLCVPPSASSSIAHFTDDAAIRPSGAGHGSAFAAKPCMDVKENDARANVTNPTEEPKGDRGGSGDRTWSPEHGEQGISNRPDDESDRLPAGVGTTDEADDKFAFGNDDDLEEDEDEDEDEVEDGDEDDDDDDDDEDEDEEEEEERRQARRKG